MSKITNTTKQIGEHPELMLGEMLASGGPRAIEAQEARGQRELVNAQMLPTDGMLRPADRAAWEAMGIKIGRPVEGDDMFTHVELPVGWSKRATDHSMWSDLVDAKGRKRAGIFYKAAFYDRSARITPVRRFEVGRDFERDDYRTVVAVQVKDCGKVVFQSEPVTVGPKDWDAIEAAEKSGTEQCMKWLADNGFADHRNPAAYWD